MTISFSNPIINYLKISEKALEQVKFLLQKRDSPCAGIKIGVRSRGCSGLSYNIEYAISDKNITRFDDMVITDNIAIFIDPKAAMFLIGSEMIYVEEELKSGFDFINPNEKGRCGCGESFQARPILSNLNQLNHFEKFAIEPDLNIDEIELEKKYLQFGQQFHPDIFANKSQIEKNLAEVNSIAINCAYQILKDPIKRAIYLLKLSSDIDLDDENCEVKAGQELLQEMLEIEEKLAENCTSNEILAIKIKAEKEISESLKTLPILFKNKSYQIAAQNLIKAKYFNKILSDLKKK